MKRRFLFTICVLFALAVTLYGTWPASAQTMPASVPPAAMLNRGSIPILERGRQGSPVNNVTTSANAQTQPSATVFVSEPLAGKIVKVDGSGTKTVFASGLTRPGPLKLDRNGNLFVLDEPRLLKITPNGSISTFTTDLPEYVDDLTITDDGKLFALVFGSEPLPGRATPVPGETASSIWELVEGGAPIFLATTVNAAPFGQSARSFTTGPGGDFYLAMQGGDGGGRILRVTRTGQVATFFDPGFPPFNSGGGDMTDVRFNSQGEMLILGHVPPGNTRVIWKVQDGVLSTFVSAGGISDDSLQLTIDAADNLFVSGGGYGGCLQIDCLEGFVKRVDPFGNVTTLATFPRQAGQQFNPISDIDDDSFDSFVPKGNAGGPYRVNEGSSVTVTASGGALLNEPLSYTWDLDEDGIFETPGQSVTFSAVTLDGPSTHTIGVQVTDSGGLTVSDQTTVDVLDVAPTADFTGTPGSLLAGGAVTLSFDNAFDPGVADTANGLHYSYDCTNDGVFELAGALQGSHACPYPLAGTFAARGRIEDKDGFFNDYTVGVVVTPAYTLTDLGTLGGIYSYPAAINEAGQVIGYLQPGGGAGQHAFVWDDGVMTDLGTLGGRESWPVAINEAGQVLGESYLADNASYHAFMWDNGVMTDLGTLGGRHSEAAAINEAGQVTGYSYLAGNAGPHAFVWDNGVMTDLGTLGGGQSRAIAINEAGQVIGWSYVAGDDKAHGFVWDDGLMTDLGTLGGRDSNPAAINEAGQVIGHSYLENGTTHAFVWDDGMMTDLGTLGGSYSAAYAINEAGQVIGATTLEENGESHAFVWENGVMTDLGTLGGSYSYPVVINEAGQVIGNSYLADNASSHAFVWEDGVMTDLGTLGGRDGEAVAINEAGQVIGWADLADDAGAQAFVWADGLMTGLGTLGGRDSRPVAINEAGEALGYSYLAGDNNDHAFIARLTSGITSAGSDVTVSPGSGTTLTFANVSSEGQTTVTTSSTAPALPAGFSLGEPPTFYDISTTATYSGLVTVCLTYDPAQYGDPANLRLLHYENNGWVDATTSNDTTEHVICGQVGSLSPFVVASRLYDFSGFFQPVDNLPTLNVVKAGSALPVKFSLGGDQGLSIFEAGYPKSQIIECSSTVDSIEQTVTAGSSSLSYDPVTNQYTYVWKTDKTWANTCRQLVIKLNDGTHHRANFQFKK